MLKCGNNASILRSFHWNLGAGSNNRNSFPKKRQVPPLPIHRGSDYLINGHTCGRISATSRTKRQNPKGKLPPQGKVEIEPRTMGMRQQENDSLATDVEKGKNNAVVTVQKHVLCRKTKIVATIGPASNTKEVFNTLADSGINVVRLNMSHGDHTSHMEVVKLVREYNASGAKTHNLAIMLDTKGPEVRSGDVQKPLNLKTSDTIVFTIKEGADGSDNRVSVNYDGFISDVSKGDMVLVDGGILSMEVEEITDTDVVCKVIDGGSMGSRRHLNVRGKSANLPAITDKDWSDIEWGVKAGVDYFALSFVRNADVIHELKEYLVKEMGQVEDERIQILAKIESADSVQNLESILDAVDGAMVARGDLGAELPVEEVPYQQNRIVQGCRARGKPCIVATNMLVCCFVLQL